MDTVRWGIIGCGDVTEVKSGPGFQRARGSRLIAVMRRNSRLARSYADRHGVPKWYDRADDLIHDKEVDAIYIATPPGSHLAYALRVCAAGKPAYVEKPMARNREECIEMYEAFKAAQVPLFIAYYRRALPRFMKAKEIIKSGLLGRPKSIVYRFQDSFHKNVDPMNLPWRLIAEESGGGHFMDMGCHALDILDCMLGPLSLMNGMAANAGSPYAVEDSIIMTIRTPDGAKGTAFWNFASGYSEDLIEIRGAAGNLSLSVFGNEPLRLETDGGVATFDLPNPRHIQEPLIQTIVDELRGSGRCPSSGENGIRTAAIMDAVLLSYYGTRSTGFWENPDLWPGNRFAGLTRR